MRRLGAGFLICALLGFGAPAPEPESSVLGIIQKRCLSCHDATARTSGLDLTNRDSALRGGKGGPALVPGNPEASLLAKKVTAGLMPPGNPLPDEERATLINWIRAGAPWSTAIQAARRRAGPDWWSLQPLHEVSPPATPDPPGEWSRSPIDRLIYAALRQKGLKPSPPADRRTLIRRASFDLLGLPPSPEDVKAFMADQREDAYERLIDRLLNSPAYGERWGRHWLDVVRFGESHGYEQNHLRERAWPYRDYVIRSFNQDKPFNRMVVEQLAGDQVARDDPAVEVGTGFLVAGIHDTVKIENIEGELQKRANDLDDVLSTTAAAFLGLTVNCARCHDHKFDPILQADYYRFQAVFAGVEHGERELATTAEKDRARKLREPISTALEEVKQQLAGLKQKAEPQAKARHDEITRGYAAPVDARGTEEKFSPAAARFIRMSIFETMKKTAPAIDEIEIWSAGASPVNVALASHGARARARSTRSTMTTGMPYEVANVIDGGYDKVWISGEEGTGEVTIELAKVENIFRIFWSRDRVGGVQGRFLNQVPTRYSFDASLDGRTWTRLADSERRLPYDEEDRHEIFLTAVLSPEERNEWRELNGRKASLEKELEALPKVPVAYIGKFTQPSEPAHLLKRGNPMEKGDVIAPGALSTLERLVPGFALAPDAPEGERRLALARWITDDRNPLTPRVLANRVWYHHFGKGLVGTPSDFGFNGEQPTHPELLDWLARRVQQLGWRLKPLHKEIMMSAAYRQSSASNAESAAVDSDARYLWRFPPRRLEAEEVRDSVLTISGRLDHSMGGPGFRLYKYTVDNVATYLPPDKIGPETYRRAVYHQAARSVKDDLLGTHDCPDSTLPEPKRVVTTTPLQALTLLNSKFMLDQAEALAERLKREAGEDPAHQVQRAYGLAFGREPNSQERSAALELIRQHSLVIFCRALMNLNEFVYVM
jgi:hypothetical protein